MLEDEGDFQRADIHIEPPPVDDLTDEDSAEEDSEVAIDNLPRRVLREQAIVTLVNPDGRTHIGEIDPQTVRMSNKCIKALFCFKNQKAK